MSEATDTDPTHPGVRSVALRDAAQVLLPPEPGLPYLRGGELNAQTLEPGSVSLRDGWIAALADDPLAERAIDCSGCAVIPGFVDCHTHLPFAGWREREYEQKVTGVAYEEIARAGGGIRASARHLADAGDEAILSQAAALAEEMLAHGTTAFECKSGYGLSPEGELRALRLAGELGARVEQPLTSTGLLAHAV